MKVSVENQDFEGVPVRNNVIFVEINRLISKGYSVFLCRIKRDHLYQEHQDRSTAAAEKPSDLSFLNSGFLKNLKTKLQ